MVQRPAGSVTPLGGTRDPVPDDSACAAATERGRARFFGMMRYDGARKFNWEWSLLSERPTSPVREEL